MKTYFRLLSFAALPKRSLPIYAVLAILAVVFGLINFSMLIPVLNVLFGQAQVKQVALPSFSFDIQYFITYFQYTFNGILLQYGQAGALQYVCVVLLISVFLSNFFKYFAQRILVDMRARMVQNMRMSLYQKILQLHIGFYNQNRKGDIISTMSNDLVEIENSVISTVQVMLREPLMLIGYIVGLFIISTKLTLFTMMVLPISGGAIAYITRRLKREAQTSQRILGDILSVTEETISGIKIIKAFNAQKYITEKFGKMNAAYGKSFRNMWYRRDVASPLSEFLGVAVVTAILLYGGTLVLKHEDGLSASQFLTYIVFYSQILVPAKAITTAIASIQKGIASGERVLKFIDTEVLIPEKPNANAKTDIQQQIDIQNISFRYETTDVLKNINLTVQKGQTIALVGQSGAGKSTMADLLPRFYDVQQGSISIDGIDVRDIQTKSLHQLMGIVTQESILFNDTIAANIAFGMETASQEDIEIAAKIANAHEFIEKMVEGYQTNIGDRGGKLSGGQRQRIAIARAVLKNPPILILDEATSALDTESERLVQDALIKLMQNRTSIVIAHRLSTIQHADAIVVMQNGEIIERGTHQSLLEANGTYKKLCDMQAFD